MIVTLFIISLTGGFLSGLLGLGGAVIMVPLMLTVPPLIGVGHLTMKSVAGLSMIQVLFSSLSGIVVHKKNNFIHTKTLLTIGIPMGLFSLLGATLSKHFDNQTVLMMFGLIIVIALLLLLVDRQRNAEVTQTDVIQGNRWLAVIAGAVVGGLSGIVGAGGGFILLPVMIVFMKIPTKIAVGTSLGIVFIGALFGSVGKIISLQVEYLLAVPVVVGSLLAAQAGARVSKNTSPQKIKALLIFIIILSLVQVCLKLYGGE